MRTTIREYKYIFKFVLKQIQMDYETKDTDISNLLSEFFELDSEKNELSSIPDCIDTLPHFPYLPDSAIRGIRLSELYKRMSAAHASSEEIEQIRVRRRRLQKSHFKQKYDRQGREAFEQLKSTLSLLTLQKEQLIQLKNELEEEINFYEENTNTTN